MTSIQNSDQSPLLIIAGNIGAGKTSLTRLLAPRLNFEPLEESVENNPFLTFYYKDPRRWSLALQMYFLKESYLLHKKTNPFFSEISAKGFIVDRSLYEHSEIFARAQYGLGHLPEDEFNLYYSLYKELIELCPKPKLLMYLQKSENELMKGIQKRGHAYEQNIQKDYLTLLNQYYEDWFSKYDLSPKILIEGDSLDFVKRTQDFEIILHQIQSHLEI